VSSNPVEGVCDIFWKSEISRVFNGFGHSGNLRVFNEFGNYSGNSIVSVNPGGTKKKGNLQSSVNTARTELTG